MHRVEIRGSWAGTTGGWRPAIAGTLNQTDKPDAQASTFASAIDAMAGIRLCRKEGASKLDLRVVEVECECPCECGEGAVGFNDEGFASCDACMEYTPVDHGDVICGHMTKGGTTCHICHEPIEWGAVQTHAPGAPNTMPGRCGCPGWAWSRWDKGGWGAPEYHPETDCDDGEEG